MSDNYSISSDLELYLAEQGWAQETEGPAGVLWSNEREGRPSAQIGVPRGLTPSQFGFSGVIDRLAAFENRAPDQVKKSVVYFSFDVTNLRAANDHRIGDSISLSAGATMTESARLMVRSSATTAEKTRPEVRGNYSKSGDGYARSARMGHTEQGSYIIPVLVRVGSSESRLPQGEPSFDGMEPRTLHIESAERRVTRTFSEAFSAVVDHIVEPAREPRQADVLGLVAAGCSREFIAAMSRVVSHPDVAEFEASFHWAQSQPPAERAVRSRSCPAGAAPLLDMAAKLMTRAPQNKNEILTGQIVEVRHQTDDPFMYVNISTVRNSRVTEVRVTQRASLLASALDWWKDAQTVSARGKIEQTSHGLQMRTPEFFGPLEALFSAKKPPVQTPR